MKPRTHDWTTLSLILFIAILQPVFSWAAPDIQLGVTQAPVGGVAAAVVTISDPSDVESFSLELNIATGNTLTLATADWFARHDYYPSEPFGSAPQVESNNYNYSHPNGTSTKVFINGFAPSGSSGSVGIVTFNVDQNALEGDTHVISLSGKYRSMNSGEVINFVTAITTFTVGPYADPVDGDANNDGQVNLADAILILQMVTGTSPSETIHSGADVNRDNQLGMEDVIFILQKVSRQRN